MAHIWISHLKNGAGRVVIETRGYIDLTSSNYLAWLGVPDHPIQRIIALGFLLSVRPINLIYVASRIVMPPGGSLHGGALRLRRRSFAVPIIVAVVSDLAPRIGHVC